MVAQRFFFTHHKLGVVVVVVVVVVIVIVVVDILSNLMPLNSASLCPGVLIDVHVMRN